ncbi:nucleotidyltransferase family protein [Reticulomyxa filosa]|uniref:Nucleotidyltransferase family protein n=1 Tax=Reticulomyxa filosa TaxID=46433 RepID=X6NL07_RETFI|nr:nucleotidyltransferase family protein [Reticulomyxa filosa]|eukprot:ETO26686.1 nucleotidyltransferase family protein [Reticulomyxa filosa]
MNAYTEQQAALAAYEHISKITNTELEEAMSAEQMNNRNSHEFVFAKHKHALNNGVNNVTYELNNITSTPRSDENKKNVIEEKSGSNSTNSNSNSNSSTNTNTNTNANANTHPNANPNSGSNTVSMDTNEKLLEMQLIQMGESMEKLLSFITPNPSDVKNISARVCQSLSNVIKGDDYFKDGKVLPYGASEHDLYLKDSNYNFCFSSTTLQLKPLDAIQLMADLMKKHTVFDKVQCTIRSKREDMYMYMYVLLLYMLGDGRPVLLFVDTKTSARCELVINMNKEIGSSRFIGAYVSIDPRFRMIAMLVKHWARLKKLSGAPPNQGLPSYALVLMVVNYLQHKRVLPTISTTVEESGESEWSRRDDYEINLNKYREFASKQHDAPARLLIGFFHYFGYEFDYNNNVVSVRTGSTLKKIEKKWMHYSKRNQVWVSFFFFFWIEFFVVTIITIKKKKNNNNNSNYLLQIIFFVCGK